MYIKVYTKSIVTEALFTKIEIQTLIFSKMAPFKFNTIYSCEFSAGRGTSAYSILRRCEYSLSSFF